MTWIPISGWLWLCSTVRHSADGSNDSQLPTFFRATHMADNFSTIERKIEAVMHPAMT